MPSRSRAGIESQPPNYEPFKEHVMAAVAELLSLQDILLDLDVTTKERAFEAIGRLLNGRCGLAQREVALALAAREQLGSTGLGHGMAIPHARLKGLTRVVAAFVRTKLPIPFEAPDEKPVSDMLVLLVPDRATQRHLALLAEVAEMFNDLRFRTRLRMCDDAAEIREAF